LPEDIRADAELVASIHDEVARSLSEAFVRTGLPIFALQNIGPVSARVYQFLESALLEEMQVALDRVHEHAKLQLRRDPYTEWLEVSYVRSVYRRIEYTLGPDAKGRVWRAFDYGYGSLGVLLSETWPRMRPLAFAVFKVLSLEARQFKDHDEVERQLRNMTITGGVH
jgi:hypothetical protein